MATICGLSAALIVAFATIASPASATELPAGFVHLSDIDPSIRQDIRYAGAENFLRRPAKGYASATCILTRQAAEALAKVQAALRADGETLVVMDCYRPRRAVADMVEWTKGGKATDPQWYPRVKRNQLVAQGYLARRSAHSRGSTVDLAIGPIAADAADRPACGVHDGRTLDFGTGVDCMDPSSATASKGMSADARKNRDKLVALMAKAGFKNYAREWWHFSLIDEPFRHGFDFEVTGG